LSDTTIADTVGVVYRSGRIIMRRRIAALIAAAAFVGLPASQSSAEPASVTAKSAAAKPCSTGYTHGVINGSHKCLRRGQFCTRSADRQYHRYGFHCHRYDSNVDRHRLT
jgi:hypothetical protein